MFCAPALFMVGLGVHARTLWAEYDTPANDPMTEKAVLAYVPYLRESLPFATRGKAEPDMATTRKIANLWIFGADQKVLRPLPPVAYDDSSSDGAKSLIFETEGRICGRILNGAKDSMLRGDVHQAVQDSVTAIRLSSILKRSDFVSLFNAACMERRAVVQLRDLVAKMDDDDRIDVVRALSVLKVDPSEIGRMATRSKQLYLDYRNRSGFPPLSIENTNLLSEIPALVMAGDDTALRRVRSRLNASNDDGLPTYGSSMKMAIGAQAMLMRESRILRSRIRTVIRN